VPCHFARSQGNPGQANAFYLLDGEGHEKDLQSSNAWILNGVNKKMVRL